ncbi:MAG TPA: AzlD domain-containing protein [Tissierellaceae bacterium]|nr:AzlD domain-containing protein [Tissierellaceae bacterium]
MNYLNLILGMALVTYIPRLLPLIFLADKRLNPKIEQFLEYIPYTSLSILIIRGILTSSADLLIPSIVGISLAGLISYLKPNLILSVVVSILASFLIINIL